MLGGQILTGSCAGDGVRPDLDEEDDGHAPEDDADAAADLGLARLRPRRLGGHREGKTPHNAVQSRICGHSAPKPLHSRRNANTDAGARSELVSRS